MADMLSTQLKKGAQSGIFIYEDFVYDKTTDTFTCPAGQTLTRRKHKHKRKAYEYACLAPVCKGCSIRSQCTRAQSGAARTIKRHYNHEAVEVGRAESASKAAKKDRIKRKWLMEDSLVESSFSFFAPGAWRHAEGAFEVT
jgi:hypothetical protein